MTPKRGPAGQATDGADAVWEQPEENTAASCKIQAATRTIEHGLIAQAAPWDCALILRRRLPECDRLWIAGAGLLSLPAGMADALAAAIRAEVERHRLSPHDQEVARQQRRWAAYCGDPARRLRRARR